MMRHAPWLDFKSQATRLISSYCRFIGVPYSIYTFSQTEI